MFGFGYVKLIGIGILVAALAGAFWYYQWSQSTITTLRENAAKLELAVQTNEAALSSLKADIARSAAANREVNSKFRAARVDNARLRDKLAKHDIGVLAIAKPGLVEKIVNRGTENAMRCFEILTGAPLTVREERATKKSQINTSCPDEANPNYRPEE